MLFVAVLLCDFYANCADIMQVVLLLCKLWVFYANSAVLMQIVLFWCKLWHLHFTIYAVLSQMTFLSRNTRFNSRHFWVCYQALNTFNDVCLLLSANFFVQTFKNNQSSEVASVLSHIKVATYCESNCFWSICHQFQNLQGNCWAKFNITKTKHRHEIPKAHGIFKKVHCNVEEYLKEIISAKHSRG